MPRAHLRALALGLTVATTVVSVAAAQPRPRPPRLATFTQPVAHEQCQDTWTFMCNIPTGDGGHYGTARPMRACTRHSFAPDGTVRVSTFGPETRGRYFIRGEQIVIETRDDDGARQRYELPLWDDARPLVPRR